MDSNSDLLWNGYYVVQWKPGRDTCINAIPPPERAWRPDPDWIAHKNIVNNLESSDLILPSHTVATVTAAASLTINIHSYNFITSPSSSMSLKIHVDTPNFWKAANLCSSTVQTWDSCLLACFLASTTCCLHQAHVSGLITKLCGPNVVTLLYNQTPNLSGTWQAL